MLFALGAAATAVEAFKSLTSAAKSAGLGQNSSDPFNVSGSAANSAPSPQATGFASAQLISPATMNALLAAQGQSTTSAPSAATSQAGALQDLFSQIDGNGDGQITKSEFENALGAGGTNTAQADDVFSKLDTNGDGTVSLSELKSALQGTGSKGGHHHHHVASASGSSSTGTGSTSGSSSTG